MQKYLCALLGAALGCVALPALAGTAVPVESFARHATVSMPQLSPDGKHLAVRMDSDDGAHALMVFAVDDMSHAISMLRMPKYEIPAGYVWVSDQRIIVEKGKEYGAIDKPMLTGEIIATDLDGKHQDYLYGYNTILSSRSDTRGHDRGSGFYDGMPEPANGHFYMSAESWDNEHQSVLYDVDATHGARHLIGDIDIPGLSFMVGKDGQGHFAFGRNEQFDYVVYHRQGSRWASMNASQVGQSFAPISSTPQGDRIYASYAPGSGPTSLVEQAEDGSARKVLAAAGTTRREPARILTSTYSVGA